MENVNDTSYDSFLDEMEAQFPPEEMPRTGNADLDMALRLSYRSEGANY